MFVVVSSGGDGACSTCVCVSMCRCMCRAPLPLVTGLEGRGNVCVCACSNLKLRAQANYCTCVLFLFILFTFSGGSGRSFITVCVHLSDRSIPEATAAAKYHTPGCTVCAAPSHSVCLLRPYYHANNIQQITRHFHLDESSSEGSYCTYRIYLPQRIFEEKPGRKEDGWRREMFLHITSQICINTTAASKIIAIYSVCAVKWGMWLRKVQVGFSMKQ